MTVWTCHEKLKNNNILFLNVTLKNNLICFNYRIDGRHSNIFNLFMLVSVPHSFSLQINILEIMASLYFSIRHRPVEVREILATVFQYRFTQANDSSADVSRFIFSDSSSFHINIKQRIFTSDWRLLWIIQIIQIQDL